MAVKTVTREVSNDIRWLEIDGGRVDYTYDPEKGWVSINYEYILLGPDRNPAGIRWKLTADEVAAIPVADATWVMTQ